VIETYVSSASRKQEVNQAVSAANHGGDRGIDITPVEMMYKATVAIVEHVVHVVYDVEKWIAYGSLLLECSTSTGVDETWRQESATSRDQSLR
jgi:hypothetical protein